MKRLLLIALLVSCKGLGVTADVGADYPFAASVGASVYSDQPCALSAGYYVTPPSPVYHGAFVSAGCSFILWESK